MGSAARHARSRRGFWGLLLTAIAVEVGATLCLKAALTSPALYPVVVVGYASAFVMLALILRQEVGLGLVYGIWSAVGVAATAGLSTLVFDEPFTSTMAIGLGLIVTGVFLIATGSATVRPRERAG